MAVRSHRIDKQAFSKEYFIVNVRTHENCKSLWMIYRL